jgi:hypothetical protein
LEPLKDARRLQFLPGSPPAITSPSIAIRRDRRARCNAARPPRLLTFVREQRSSPARAAPPWISESEGPGAGHACWARGTARRPARDRLPRCFCNCAEKQQRGPPQLPCMHPDTAAVMARTSSARLLSPVQADVAEFTRPMLAPDDERSSPPTMTRRSLATNSERFGQPRGSRSLSPGEARRRWRRRSHPGDSAAGGRSAVIAAAQMHGQEHSRRPKVRLLPSGEAVA